MGQKNGKGHGGSALARRLQSLGINTRVLEEREGELMLSCTYHDQRQAKACFKIEDFVHDGELVREESGKPGHYLIEVFFKGATWVVLLHDGLVRGVWVDATRSHNRAALYAALERIVNLASPLESAPTLAALPNAPVGWCEERRIRRELRDLDSDMRVWEELQRSARTTQ